MAEVIHADDYDNPGATLRVWNAVLQRIQRQAQDAEINNEFPEFASDIFEIATTAGHGEKDVAALIKVLRGA